jgi:hypothetical protein
MLTSFFEATRLYDATQVRELTADMCKNCVPLRERAYRELFSVLKSAQQAGQSLQDVISVLSASPTIEAALLLRDLWEVITVSNAKQDQHSPEGAMTLMHLVRELFDEPYSGEEVLF